MSEDIISEVELHRAAELILGYLADDEERFGPLLDHTVAEFGCDAVIRSVICLGVGTIKGIGGIAGEYALRHSLADLLTEPIAEGDLPWPTL